MTSNKRKRATEEDDQSPQKKHHQSNDVQNPEKISPPQPPVAVGIISTAIEKIVELEKYINRPNPDSDDEYSSDYSDFSDRGCSDSIGGDDLDNQQPKVTQPFCPEIFGFAVCAQETINFLAKEGFTEDNPLVRMMQQRLIDHLNQYQANLNGSCKETPK